jgi:hypothetical protein
MEIAWACSFFKEGKKLTRKNRRPRPTPLATKDLIYAYCLTCSVEDAGKKMVIAL